MKGDVWLAWSTDEEILRKADYGGVVTSLLKFALEGKKVDAVLAVRAREDNRYDGIPVVLTDPADLAGTTGTLHCTSPNIARCLTEYLDGAMASRIATVCKPCDARAIIELVKRKQINLDNLLLIGLNCTGTLSSVGAKEMLQKEFGVDPSDVVREDIEEGRLTIWLRDGTEKTKDLHELEQRGYGRRENCRRCDIKVPRMADLACGKWGTNGRKATLIEVCSDKGSDFLEKAIEAGVIKVEQPDKLALEDRHRREEQEIELARKWQTSALAELEEMNSEERFNYWMSQFQQCLKCYGCRDACPICYCKDCELEADRGIVPAGEIPPSVMFPMIRITHVMDSCVNCGQCQDVCPAEIPLSRLILALNRELVKIFDYEPGVSVSALPPLRTATDEELALEAVDLV